MPKKYIILISILIIIIVLAVIFWPQLRGLKPALLPASKTPANVNDSSAGSNAPIQASIN